MLNLKLSAHSKFVLIGASTGGPGQIQKIIDTLPKLHNTTVIIAQHMVEGFMDSFAKRLQNHSINPISVIKDTQKMKPANIYICEGNTQLTKNSSEFIFNKKAATIDSFNPDINILFNSFVPLCKDSKILSVILTGIGDDGVDACRELSLNGARCLTESQESAIVDGMPNRARLLVPNIEVSNMENVVKTIKEFCD